MKFLVHTSLVRRSFNEGSLIPSQILNMIMILYKIIQKSLMKLFNIIGLILKEILVQPELVRCHAPNKIEVGHESQLWSGQFSGRENI